MVLADCFLFSTFPVSLFFDMELELSLGVSPALSKGTVMPVLTTTHGGLGEGHELVLELGVRTAKEAEEDNLKPSMQPKDAREEHESRTHGSVNSEPVHRQQIDVDTVPVDGGMSRVRPLSICPSLQVEVPVSEAAHRKASEDEENGGIGGGARKKLRLTKEQSAFLEDSFKEHSTPTAKQRSDSANRLNLEPRQVEVWYQNRRARTKLKQTEVDCKNLKRCCEKLIQDKRRLEREVTVLRAFHSTLFLSKPPTL